MLNKTKQPIKNGQSRDTMLYWAQDTERRQTKQKTQHKNINR